MIFGTETEIFVTRDIASEESVDGLVLLRLIHLARTIFGVDDPALRQYGRVSLRSGAVIYIDGNNLEYATPPCANVDDVILHERDLRRVLMWVSVMYRSEFKEALHFLYPGSTTGDRLDCGYHENYGFPHEEYFRLFYDNFRPRPVWDRILVPFLVSRIIHTGTGAVIHDARPPGWKFVISPRATATTHVFHQSSSPQKPIVHLKRPQLRDKILRVQLTCGDCHSTSYAKRLMLSITSLTLRAAVDGKLDDMDLTLADPVDSIHSLSLDRNAQLPLARGGHVTALEVNEAVAGAVGRSFETLTKAGGHVDFSQTYHTWAKIRKPVARQ